jgi:hypothetical protein
MTACKISPPIRVWNSPSIDIGAFPRSHLYTLNAELVSAGSAANDIGSVGFPALVIGNSPFRDNGRLLTFGARVIRV